MDGGIDRESKEEREKQKLRAERYEKEARGGGTLIICMPNGVGVWDMIAGLWRGSPRISLHRGGVKWQGLLFVFCEGRMQ